MSDSRTDMQEFEQLEARRMKAGLSADEARRWEKLRQDLGVSDESLWGAAAPTQKFGGSYFGREGLLPGAPHSLRGYPHGDSYVGLAPSMQSFATGADAESMPDRLGAATAAPKLATRPPPPPPVSEEIELDVSDVSVLSASDLELVSLDDHLDAEVLEPDSFEQTPPAPSFDVASAPPVGEASVRLFPGDEPTLELLASDIAAEMVAAPAWVDLSSPPTGAMSAPFDESPSEPAPSRSARDGASSAHLRSVTAEVPVVAFPETAKASPFRSVTAEVPVVALPGSSQAPMANAEEFEEVGVPSEELEFEEVHPPKMYPEGIELPDDDGTGDDLVPLATASDFLSAGRFPTADDRVPISLESASFEESTVDIRSQSLAELANPKSASSSPSDALEPTFDELPLSLAPNIDFVSMTVPPVDEPSPTSGLKPEGPPPWDVMSVPMDLGPRVEHIADADSGEHAMPIVLDLSDSADFELDVVLPPGPSTAALDIDVELVHDEPAAARSAEGPTRRVPAMTLAEGGRATTVPAMVTQPDTEATHPRFSSGPRPVRHAKAASAVEPVPRSGEPTVRVPMPRVDGTHRVIVHTLDGKVERGLLRDAELTGPTLRLETPSSDKHQALAAGRLKAIFFLLEPNAKAGSVPKGRRLRVTFQDGRQLVGHSDDVQVGAPGFFLVPADSKGIASRIFVYRSAVHTIAELPAS